MQHFLIVFKQKLLSPYICLFVNMGELEFRKLKINLKEDVVSTKFLLDFFYVKIKWLSYNLNLVCFQIGCLSLYNKSK